MKNAPNTVEEEFFSTTEWPVKHKAHSVVTWVIKGALAIADQGLISGSNFLVSILLARWLVPEQYGAFGLAFECFLVLYVVYSAMILEPMCVFGPSVYQDDSQEYLRVLLRFHLCASMGMAFVFIVSACLVHEFARSSSLTWALVGVALGGPCILFFWLVRRAIYMRLAPREAIAGASLYCSIVLAGLFVCYKLRFISPFVALFLMSGGALCAGTFMLLRVKASSAVRIRQLGLHDVARRHWIYGRWALAGSLVMSLPSMIYYPLLTAFRGLTETADMKALLNFSSPVGQFFSALFLLFLPYAARSHHEHGPAKIERLAWRSTFLYGGMATGYWAIFLLLKGPIMRFVYGGKYLEVASLIPWLALTSVLQIAAAAQATALRAGQAPDKAFVAFSASGAVAALIGFPAIWAFGLQGAIFTNVLSTATALVALSILLRRTRRPITKAFNPATIRAAWLAPSVARGYYWQPVFKQLKGRIPNTLIFTACWPGFLPGYEGTFQVRQLPGFKFIALKRASTSYESGFMLLPSALIRELLRYRPHVIFLGGFNLWTLYAIAIKVFRRCPIILLFEGISPTIAYLRSPVRLWTRRLMARFIDASVCNTRDGLEYLRDVLLISESKLLHHPCEIPDVNVLTSGSCDQDVFPSSICRPSFLFAGSIIQRKGWRSLLQAAQLLVERGEERFSIIFVGGGEEAGQLQELTSSLQLEKLVRAVGPVRYEDLGAYFRSCDVFVLPTLEDTWAVVISEAMAFGKPILCSKYAGAKELVEPAVNGFIFDPYNPAELANYMAHFIQQPKSIKEFGSQSKKKIAPYTPERAADVLATAVCRVLSPRGADVQP